VSQAELEAAVGEVLIDEEALLARIAELGTEVSLMTKPSRRQIDVPVRYIGFEIPNRFVIGYGLDFAERYRNLPYVAVMDEELIPGGCKPY
jgi:hypoxanthine phosphoribosyltransferase